MKITWWYIKAKLKALFLKYRVCPYCDGRGQVNIMKGPCTHLLDCEFCSQDGI
jgi:hypothetical protein